MGQADVNVNLWLKDTKRFADLFNAILFQGKAVILPENLHPSPETTAVSLQDAQGKNVVKKQYRDIIMNWQDQAVLMLLAVESQTAIHYAAPLKVMLYDSMEYAEQVRVKWKERPPRLSSAEFLSRFQKNDKLIPVITLIFYYGTEEWDGPLELHQMFDLGTEKKHAELMKKYLPNYHINLVDVRRLKNLESFQSDLQIIFGMLQCSQDKYALRTYVANHKDYFQKLDLETYHALGAFLNSRQLMEINVEKNEREELDMCKALEDIYNEVFRLEKSQVDILKEDITNRYRLSRETFQDAPEKDQEFLKTFSFIWLLSFDVYVKKQIIEKLLDEVHPQE